MTAIVVAYVASRFPEVTQTWMLREIDAVAEEPDIECELFGLFPPMKRTGTLHPSAERWMEHLVRPGPGASLRAALWWTTHRPRQFLGALGSVVRAYWRRPGLLVKALVTVATASGHARAIEGLGVSHLHAHTATYPLLAAWFCRRLTGATYSFTAHAHDIFMDQTFLRERLAEARFAVAISEFNREFMAPFGNGSTPVHVIRCGIDVSAYRFRARDLEREGAVRALAIGGLKDYKGHRYLLEALAGTPQLERVALELVGDGPLREELVAIADRLGLGDRVTFHGALPEPEVIAHLDRADLFVLPSIVTPEGNSEGLPVVLMEAMAAGAPVVATRITGVPELVRDGETGLLVGPADSSALGAGIAAVLADPDAARRRSEAARLLVEREYDVQVTGPALARLFRESHDAGKARGGEG
jgi:glycosyltransferase involved in cell wall biosynthesis